MARTVSFISLKSRSVYWQPVGCVEKGSVVLRTPQRRIARGNHLRSAVEEQGVTYCGPFHPRLRTQWRSRRAVFDFDIHRLTGADWLDLAGSGLVDRFPMGHPPGCPLFDIPICDARAGRQQRDQLMGGLRPVLRLSLQATQDQGFELRANGPANSGGGGKGFSSSRFWQISAAVSPSKRPCPVRR